MTDSEVAARHGHDPLLPRFPEGQRRDGAAAQPHRTIDDRIQRRLDVGRGLGDHAHDLRRRRLLLQRLGQLSVQACDLGVGCRELFL